MTIRLRTIAVGAAVATMLGTVAVGSAMAADITIADKGFTESQIVAALYTEALGNKGFDVSDKSLGSAAIADAAVRRGDIDLYPEYSGTALLDILKKKGTTNGATNFAAIKKAYAARGLTALNQSPYNNDNRVACTKAAVSQYKLTTLSSLGKQSGNIVYSANTEHTTRPDGLPLLAKSYNVQFKQVIPVALNQRYKPIQDKKAQCVYAFGTDPQIAKLGLVVMRDDKRIFQGTPYQNFPVVNTKYLNSLTPAERSTLIKTVNKVSAALTSAKMSALNARVDLENEDVNEIAKQFLIVNKLR